MIDKMRLNPFDCAEFMTDAVDGLVFSMRKVKLGGTMLGLRKWQQLPLLWTQTMNETFESIEEGSADGWWCVSDDTRERRERENQKELVALKKADEMKLIESVPWSE